MNIEQQAERLLADGRAWLARGDLLERWGGAMSEIEQFRAEYRAMVEYGEAEAVFKLVERLLARLREVQEERDHWKRVDEQREPAFQRVIEHRNELLQKQHGPAMAKSGQLTRPKSHWELRAAELEAERDQLRQQLAIESKAHGATIRQYEELAEQLAEKEQETAQYDRMREAYMAKAEARLTTLREALTEASEQVQARTRYDHNELHTLDDDLEDPSTCRFCIAQREMFARWEALAPRPAPLGQDWVSRVTSEEEK